MNSARSREWVVKEGSGEIGSWEGAGSTVGSPVSYFIYVYIGVVVRERLEMKKVGDYRIPPAIFRSCPEKL